MGFNNTRVNTSVISNAITEEGGKGFLRDPKMELYSLVVTSFLSGDSYYEKGEDRLTRLKDLFRQTLSMKDGKEFISGLAVYARNDMYMRSSPTMLSAELFLHNVEGADKVAKHVWNRGDEHLEALAYVKSIEATRPKKMLKAIANRLNNLDAYHAIKYASTNKTFSQRDALRLAHPIPKNPKQSVIFKYITQGWGKLTEDDKMLVPEITSMKTGESFTWEQQISTKGSTKENWEASIPKMGYMALLRNLRNFLEKGVSEAIIESVAKKLSDPEEVKRSKQLPFRFWNAYKVLSTLNVNSSHRDILGRALRKAMDLSVVNVPDLGGDTLILVDISGSMAVPLATPRGRDTTGITNMEMASLMGSIISMKASGEVWPFGTNTERANFSPGSDVFSRVEKIQETSSRLGWGTNIAQSFNVAVSRTKKPYKRCIVITDMQSTDDVWASVKNYRNIVPNFSMYVIDLSGYKVSCLPKGNGCYQLAGFSDKLFNWISEEEATHGAVIKKITDIGKMVLSDTYQKPNIKNVVVENAEAEVD